MTNKDAIKEAKIQIEIYETLIQYNNDFEPKNDNSNYENKIDFLKTVIEALEKQIPKQPKRIGELDIDSNAEVECECFATQDVAIKTIKRVHCWRCGQLLDWSGEDDELCPHCGKHYEIDYDDYKYCPERGQAIDWSEDDE